METCGKIKVGEEGQSTQEHSDQRNQDEKKKCIGHVCSTKKNVQCSMTETSCLHSSRFTRQENRMKLIIYTLVSYCKLINIPPILATYVFGEELKAKEC